MALWGHIGVDSLLWGARLSKPTGELDAFRLACFSALMQQAELFIA